MKNVTFDLQVRVAILISAIGFMLAMITNNSLYVNISGVFYGMMFLTNPVVPESMIAINNAQRYIRLFGFAIVVLSLLLKFGG